MSLQQNLREPLSPGALLTSVTNLLTVKPKEISRKYDAKYKRNIEKAWSRRAPTSSWGPFGPAWLRPSCLWHSDPLYTCVTVMHNVYACMANASRSLKNPKPQKCWQQNSLVVAFRKYILCTFHLTCSWFYLCATTNTDFCDEQQQELRFLNRHILAKGLLSV